MDAAPAVDKVRGDARRRSLTASMLVVFVLGLTSSMWEQDFEEQGLEGRTDVRRERRAASTERILVY